ncbi:Biorientation of chromosomes in cell division protein 1 [Fukomys damarensis]|uniref:Biorientation of chromosomes in cell division protein 1 n=1 Tax=Fukomys damarensis TaxID=885580 RepID=A0A091CWW7_FUKDA|nr:Biorientation of chromosomes in cell division protein 1 [Fukomys damarensis]
MADGGSGGGEGQASARTATGGTGVSGGGGPVNPASLPPGDPQLKSPGPFDSFRQGCPADLDTKPVYQNLRQKVDNFVSTHLDKQEWNPTGNKNRFGNGLGQRVVQSGMLETGVDGLYLRWWTQN